MVLNMKKVAIVSCYFQPNYGSMIQALGTQMALDRLGYDNETVSITGFNREIKKAKLKYFIKASFTTGILFTKLGRVKNVIKKKFNKGEYSKKLEKRTSGFKTFEKKYFRLSKEFSSIAEMSRDCGEMYSAVLVGSDQLWLPGNIAADYYTLSWVPESVNSIAYATSFGQSSLPGDSAAKASVFLNRIRHIGVREESGQRLVKELTGRDVPVVCDPTLLFTGDEWLSIQKATPIIKEDYIFCYFLGGNPLHRKFAERLKKETGCKIVILPHIDEYVKSDEEIADQCLYDVDPGDFLNLIRNAKYVCTDSFHCSVFSMQYERTFFTFRRFSSKNKQSTNSRLDTLFSVAGVSGRLMTGDEDIAECLQRKIDYSAVKKNLNTLREKSYRYLEAALSDERSTDL